MTRQLQPPRPAEPAPSRHRRALLTWVAIFPSVLVVQILLAPIDSHWPLPLRTLALTLLVVPLAAYVLIPALLRTNAHFLKLPTKQTRPS